MTTRRKRSSAETVISYLVSLTFIFSLGIKPFEKISLGIKPFKKHLTWDQVIQTSKKTDIGVGVQVTSLHK